MNPHPSPPVLQRPPNCFSLVLGGGLARGAAHLGVWRALRGAQLLPERVVGVSIGAIVGAYLCKEGGRGEALAHLQGLAQALRSELTAKGENIWDTWRLISLERRRAFVEETLGLRGLTFSALPLPLYITATRLLPPGRVVFGDHPTESVTEAILASTAILTHPPVRVGRHYYMDGGVSGNLPVMEAMKRGGRVILTVNLGPPIRRGRGTGGEVLWRLCRGVSGLTSLREIERCKARGAIVLQVSSAEIESHGIFTFKKLDMVEEEGYKATQYLLPTLREALRRLGEEDPTASGTQGGRGES
ncbi:MAG: patatin-like phospholipase family protein [Candidatus Methylomirabilales bacterium]